MRGILQNKNTCSHHSSDPGAPRAVLDAFSGCRRSDLVSRLGIGGINGCCGLAWEPLPTISQAPGSSFTRSILQRVADNTRAWLPAEYVKKE